MPTRADTLAELSKWLGVSVAAVYKSGPDSSPVFSLEIDSELYFVGRVANLISQKKIRNVLATAGKMMPRIKRKEWTGVVQLMLDCCLRWHVNESQALSAVADYLFEYLNSQPVQHADSSDLFPRLISGRIHFLLSQFADWITETKGIEIPPERLAESLRLCGAEMASAAIRLPDGRRTSRSTFVVVVVPSADYPN